MPRYPKNFDVRKARTGEKIGGGYIVMRRGKKTGRVSVMSTLPFEHPDFASAYAEVQRLMKENPKEKYEIFCSFEKLFNMEMEID